MKDYGRRKDKLAVVVVGEASESDDEYEEKEDDERCEQREQDRDKSIDHRASSIVGKYVDAKRVTDSKSSFAPHTARHLDRKDAAVNDDDEWTRSERRTSNSSTSSNSRTNSLNTDANNSRHNRTKDSLLQNLLKESNENLRSNLINLTCTPYAAYNKDICRITRNMIAIQKQLQSGCALLQKANNDVNHLNKSFIALSTHNIFRQ